MNIYLVMCDTRGAHESPDLMSVWTTRAGAEAEVVRLESAGVKATTTHGGRFAVVEVEADAPSDSFVDVP